MKTITKDPDATILVEVRWGPWLNGDTIATPTWVSDVGITATADSNTTTEAFALVAGGTVGERYRVTSRIATAGGQINDQSFWVRIVPK